MMDCARKVGGIERLREFLSTREPGKIKDEETIGRISSLVADSWEEFSVDGDDGGMKPDKAWDRLEEVKWEPPLLFFKIERHGAASLGSSRAEMQGWTVDVDDGSAGFSTAGYRQMSPREPNLDVGPIVKGLRECILAGGDDSRLTWMGEDRNDVRVLMGVILPEGSAVKQTLAGRRKRLGNLLTALLASDGWRKIKVNRYCRPAALSDTTVQ